MPTLLVPMMLQKFTQQEKIFIAGKSLNNLLKNFVKQFPETNKYIFDDQNELNTFLMLYLNNKIIRSKKELAQAINNDDVIEILLSIAGG